MNDLKRKADEFLGEKETGLLEEVISLLEKRDKYSYRENQRLLGALEGLTEEIKQGNEQTTDAFAELEAEIRGIDIPNEVTVKNQVEIPKPVTEVTVKNMPEPQPFPSEISTKEPKWLDKYFKSIEDTFASMLRKKQRVDIQNRDASNPIAVRLSDGKRFYNALVGAAVGMAKAAFPFENSSGNPTAALVNDDGSVVIDSKEVTDFEGAPVTVGTTAVELTFSGTTQSIQIQADHDNSGTIWYGKSNVTNAGANAFGRLEAGEAVQFDLNDASTPVYAVSDTASQKVFKMALV